MSLLIEQSHEKDKETIERLTEDRNLWRTRFYEASKDIELYERENSRLRCSLENAIDASLETFIRELIIRVLREEKE